MVHLFFHKESIYEILGAEVAIAYDLGIVWTEVLHSP